MKARIRRKRQRVRLMVLTLKAAGECQQCGYDRHPAALTFHHRDPSEKKFHIGRGKGSRSMKQLLEEIAKCDLICENCHREMEAGPYVEPTDV